MKISERFRYMLWRDGRSRKEIAQKAGVSPHSLAQLLSGYAVPRENDERIIKVGKVIGLEPNECFDDFNLLQGNEK